MKATLPNLIERIEVLNNSDTNVIAWGSPVPSFGDISKAEVATLGLNPSNREFVDQNGNELTGAHRRFHTLKSLGLQSWSDSKREHVNLIAESCKNYFNHNPYDGWFRQLDHIISGTHTSYYEANAKACHLDLIPYATACKWTGLTKPQKNSLVKVAGDTLGHLLNDSPVRILILNGKSVIEQFQEMAEVTLEVTKMPDWSLKRGDKARIDGNAYRGAVKQVAGVGFGREILVLGFNHNLQSSFGVTNQVRASIRDWITKVAKDVML
jgi:hypothetical protein